MVKLSTKIHDIALLNEVKALLDKYGVSYSEEEENDTVKEYLHESYNQLTSGKVKLISQEEFEERLSHI